MAQDGHLDFHTALTAQFSVALCPHAETIRTVMAQDGHLDFHTVLTVQFSVALCPHAETIRTVMAQDGHLDCYYHCCSSNIYTNIYTSCFEFSALIIITVMAHWELIIHHQSVSC